MNYQLSIDTSVRGQVTIIVKNDSEEVFHEVTASINSSQSVIRAIDSACSALHIEPKDFASIEVSKGPGSYTGLRVGAAVGQTIGAYFGIPVNGKSADAPVDFVYEQNDKWG